nr:hypothetical protein [Aquimarina agarivorans]
MFSQKQLIFAICFFIAFVIFMVFSYRKDISIHKKFYKGSFWILLFFVGFILFLFGLKTYLNF